MLARPPATARCARDARWVRRAAVGVDGVVPVDHFPSGVRDQNPRGRGRIPTCAEASLPRGSRNPWGVAACSRPSGGQLRLGRARRASNLATIAQQRRLGERAQDVRRRSISRPTQVDIVFAHDPSRWAGARLAGLRSSREESEARRGAAASPTAIGTPAVLDLRDSGRVREPEPNPVIEAYKKDVDRTLLRENLKLTPTNASRSSRTSWDYY